MWRTVKSGKGFRGTVAPQVSYGGVVADEDHTPDAVKRIARSRNELSNSGMESTFLRLLADFDYSNSIDIVCFGIGSIGTSSNSAYQLALLLALNRPFKFFDPILNPSEIKLLESFGGTQITENHFGGFVVDTPTLFYMPHCDRPLYNNLISANWNSLENVLIFGNSFREFSTQTRIHAVTDDAFISSVVSAKIVTEIGFRCVSKLESAFNHTSLHAFKPTSGINKPE